VNKKQLDGYPDCHLTFFETNAVNGVRSKDFGSTDLHISIIVDEANE
jgi:hypothetical protein